MTIEQREEFYLRTHMGSGFFLDEPFKISTLLALFTFAGAVWMIGFVGYNFTNNNLIMETQYEDRPGYIETNRYPEGNPETFVTSTTWNLLKVWGVITVL